MAHRRGWLIGLLLVTTAMAKGPRPEPAKTSAADLEYEVAALRTMRELDLTPEQVKMLGEMAGKTAGKAAEQKAAAEFRAALVELADALAVNDEEKLDAADEKVDGLRESLKIEPIADPAPTTAARAEALRFASSLTASQVASFVAEHSDEVPDPVQTMLDAVTAARGTDPAEFNKIKSEAVEQFAMLVAGVDPSTAEPVAVAAGVWFDKMKVVAEKDFEAGHDEHVKQLKALAKDVSAFDVLKHWTDREIVDLLSNPQLAAAAKRIKL